ncbi:MAG TPA: L,D-transpeptidase family protein [Candidatus Binatia bacterium]|nr:L,D-transpeptidase family protein [Candidatus Binatia bacterium]
MTRHPRLIAFAAGVLVAACSLSPRADARVWDEQDFWRNPPKVYTFAPPGQAGPDGVVTVIGQNRTYVPEKGDTFLDIARYFDLGFNEIADANPHSDEWIPATAGDPLVIPQEFVLPAGTYSGIVINIPEMRLYYYPPRKNGAPATVITFPVGLGREDWKTPIGKFTIRSKDVNPAWVIPESIRKERIADRGYSEQMIPGGDPMNPLGKYRMRLTLNLYGIHGTNIPWGVGMLVSHGCVRLYPEDIEHFFPMVPVGQAGEFVYQTVKVGERDGRVYVEIHKDLYGTQPGPWRQAAAILRQRNLIDRVDEKRLMAAVEAQSGVPVDITRDARRDGAAREAVPREVMSRDVDPRGAMPRDAMPRDGMPRDGMPRDTMPRDAAPRGAVPPPAAVDPVSQRVERPADRPAAGVEVLPSRPPSRATDARAPEVPPGPNPPERRAQDVQAADQRPAGGTPPATSVEIIRPRQGTAVRSIAEEDLGEE